MFLPLLQTRIGVPRFASPSASRQIPRRGLATLCTLLAGMAALVAVPATHAASYDADLRDDMVVWRPSTGTWHILMSSTQFVDDFSRQWGTLGDIPVADTDLDGDGRDDIVVWRPST